MKKNMPAAMKRYIKLKRELFRKERLSLRKWLKSQKAIEL